MRRDLPQTNGATDSDFRRTVEKLSGQSLGDCSQCGKCSGGCPVLPEVDVSTNRIMRMVQLGLKDDVLSSPSLWRCTACGTCNGRCPMGVDIVRVMDTLRGMVPNLSAVPGALEVWTFYEAFLDCVKEFGRLTEIGLMGGYNINSGRLMTNVHKAPWFLMKGKLAFSPHTIRRIDRLQRVCARIEEIEST